MRIPRIPRHALLIAALVAATGCKPDTPPPAKPDPVPNDVAMIIAGKAIPRAEVERLTKALRKATPQSGRNATIRFVLDRYLVPLAFAREEFAAARVEARRRANAVAKVLGGFAGVADLRTHSKRNEGGEELEKKLRAEWPIPERLWLFAEENVLRVSPVLETDQGFSLVAATNKTTGLTKAFDTVDAVVLRFYTHKGKAHVKWLTALRRRLGAMGPDQLRVHPDFKDAVPQWPKPEKKPATPPQSK